MAKDYRKTTALDPVGAHPANDLCAVRTAFSERILHIGTFTECHRWVEEQAGMHIHGTVRSWDSGLSEAVIVGRVKE